MRVTYTAPNRAHHYAYAAALARARSLEAFVCGFSRFSPRATLSEVGSMLVRRDEIQNIYLAALHLGVPALISDALAYASKLWLDKASESFARESDVFVFYNGAGLSTAQKLRGTRTLRVVEVVNSHVLTQQEILREEYATLNIPFRPFYKQEVTRRVTEYEEADLILGPSKFVERSFREHGFSSDRFIRVPYGFHMPPERFVRADASDGVFRILYVGQVAIRKGVRYLVEAFRRFVHPRKELWIVGPTASPTGLEGVSIPEGVRFCGVLKGEALLDAYRNASVFVLASLEEGFALVLGEALAAGVPVIATVNTGAADLFENGSAGWIVPIRNSDAIAEKLQELADDTERLNSMSAAARDLRKTLGGWEIAGQRLVDALMHAVGNHLSK